MRLHSESNLRSLITVYLDGNKEPHAIEAYVPGNAIEGAGCVFRQVVRDGKGVASISVAALQPDQYDLDGALCEKVSGRVRIEIADDVSQFEDK